MNTGKKRFHRWVAFALFGSIAVAVSACGEAPGVPRGASGGGVVASSNGADLSPSSASGGESAKPSKPAEPSAPAEESKSRGSSAGSSAGGSPSSGGAAGGSGGGSSGGGAAVAGDVVEIELKDYEFAPVDVKVKAKNGEVRFLWKNTSTHAHNYRILKGDQIVYPGPKVGAKKKREETLKLAPGEYEVICNLSDHEERGMKGKLIVE